MPPLQTGDWEATQAIDHGRFAHEVRESRAHRSGCQSDIVIVEGFQAFHDEEIVALMDLRLWLSVSEATCRRRRAATSPVPPGYFDGVLWPSHVAYRERILNSTADIVRLDSDELSQPALVDAALAQIREKMLSRPQHTRLHT